MRAVNLVLAAALLTPWSGASADTLTWYLKNSHPNAVQIVFYSQTRTGQTWPSTGAYDLKTSRIETIGIECQTSEKVCYGAWVAGRGAIHWGVGVGGTQACQGCCAVCGTSKSVDLIESASLSTPAAAGANAVKSFKWAYNAQPSPGTRTWFLDEASRWHERYPDGHEAKVFDRVTRGTANGCAGGVAASSLEPDFQVFIPDLGCAPMAALFRRGQTAWNTMGQMFDVR